ncbi:hypothetical protein C8A03DRAFT_31402 [Achaetomium macrosporum]|uniref:Uncharacterized protein n=1 Tax=Achaetomium macrosporum TaxID=79813 RepID=A0AAN7CF61_9PEZI|nr:hypothetical protein C8A03DRAFT_31402 [Achaetomium macrosporum]
MAALGMWSSDSQITTGSASAIELLVKRDAGQEELDRVVVAAACPMFGRATHLVRVNEGNVKELADLNDTKGYGDDYTKPWSGRLPKSQLQLDVRTEERAKTFGKYCHTLVIVSQPGMVMDEVRAKL